ncbi:MAG: IS4 family transposase, partial [Microcystis aeruginosa LG13-03]|nr:IS4 family transposase [Microcystis aeruginosa LG13-13]NCR06835.1 IS4 family transposase [Microcystis aeruginosa LG13-03]NCR65028.1 IS4 family transposase [Microcystis aeruginosa LG11-05]
LEKLAALFPQPITFESRRRNLPRFLKLPQLNVKLLWFPLIKQIVKLEFSGKNKNREQRRRLQKLKQAGRLLVVIDRTDWKGRNLFVASVICGRRALPVSWVLLNKKGSSDLGEQKKFIKPVLRLLKPYPLVVMGDREFQSVQLGKWLDDRGVAFIFRQKKSTYTRLKEEENYQALSELEPNRGERKFFRGVTHTKSHQIGGFNLAIYWKRRYRSKGSKEPWYLLTNLESLELTLKLYRARFGIEAMFKDCKTGGYNLEKTKVSEPRFLALVLLIAIAYSLNTTRGQNLKKSGTRDYICRSKEAKRGPERHSDFWIGTYGTFWVESMDAYSELAFSLIRLKPGKHPNFSRGLTAMRLIQQAF